MEQRRLRCSRAGGGSPVRRSRRRRDGFTLLETVVVLAVVGALVAAIAPATFTYVRDAQRTEAMSDANRIAEALGRFVSDVRIPPYKNNSSASKTQVKESADFDCLAGGGGNDHTTVTDVTAGDSWTSGAGVQCQAGSTTRDTLENHLITNTPGASGTKAYATTGRFAWKGPYLPSVPQDPWGNKYIVNVGKFDPAVAKATWVLSAGPDGNIDTASDASSTATVAAAGDDIIARVR